jgi:hypothetical protein
VPDAREIGEIPRFADHHSGNRRPRPPFMIAAARDRILGASSAKGMSAAAAWLSSASRSDATAARVNVHQGYAAFEVGFAIGAVATTYSSNRLAFPRPPRPCPETTSEACLQAISHRGFR